jgi:hypothetical protein
MKNIHSHKVIGAQVIALVGQRDKLLSAANAVRYADSRESESDALDMLYKLIDEIEAVSGE